MTDVVSVPKRSVGSSRIVDIGLLDENGASKIHELAAVRGWQAK